MYAFHNESAVFSLLKLVKGPNGSIQKILIGKTYSVPKGIGNCLSVDFDERENIYLTCLAQNHPGSVIVHSYKFSDNREEDTLILQFEYKFEVTGILTEIKNAETRITEDKSNNQVWLMIIASGESIHTKSPDRSKISSTYSLLQINGKNNSVMRLHDTKLIMFGTAKHLKLIERDDKLFLLSIFKDSACYNGHPFINNGDFRKCDSESLDRDERYYGQRNSSYSLRYLLVSFNELISLSNSSNQSPKYASLCSKDMLIGDLYYGTDSAITFLNQNGITKGLVLTGSIHPKNLDSYTKVLCGVPLEDYSYAIDQKDRITGRLFGFTFNLPISSENYKIFEQVKNEIIELNPDDI